MKIKYNAILGRTNTLFKDGVPPAPENGASRKQLTALGQRAEECMFRALAESHLNEAVRREVGRVWADYKVAMEHALHQMVEAAVDEMLTTKESFAKLQEVVTRLIREESASDVKGLYDRLGHVLNEHDKLINRVGDLEYLDSAERRRLDSIEEKLKKKVKR